MSIIQKKKIIKLLLAVSLLAFLMSSIALSRSVNTKIEVDHVAGKIEKIKEKIILFTRFNKKSKINYLQFLLEKRLAELSFVIETDQIDLVEPTASRYSTYAGRLAEYVVAKNLAEKKGDLISAYLRHSEIIKTLQKKFEFESGWWLALQHSIDSTKIYSEKVEGI